MYFILGCILGTILGIILVHYLNKLWVDAHEDDFKAIKSAANLNKEKSDE